MKSIKVFTVMVSVFDYAPMSLQHQRQTGGRREEFWISFQRSLSHPVTRKGFFVGERRVECDI